MILRKLTTVTLASDISACICAILSGNTIAGQNCGYMHAHPLVENIRTCKPRTKLTLVATGAPAFMQQAMWSAFGESASISGHNVEHNFGTDMVSEAGKNLEPTLYL